MTLDIRNGIRAKNVYLSFCDLIRDGSTKAFTNAQFTGNSLENFWGAYYGDLTLDSLGYSIVDLGFDGTAATVSQIWKAAGVAYDTVASITGAAITLTTAVTDVTDHAGKYVILRHPTSGKKVFARVVSNTNLGVITLDSNVETLYGVAATWKVALLKVPCGLTMSAFHRLDHVATNFSIEPPKTETEESNFLGTSDSAGSQNQVIDKQPLTKMIGSVTVRGGTADLLRLKYGQDSTVPSGTLRYNLGSEVSEDVGFVACWSTNPSDPDHADAVTKYVACNNVVVLNVGLLDTVDSDGRAEATIEFEVKPSDVRVEVYAAQANDTAVNI